MARIRACFTGVCASDQEGMDAIARVYRDHGYLMDPHTAVAWRGMEKAGTGSAPCVVLSTASPCKFPACVLTALGQSVPAGRSGAAGRADVPGRARCPARWTACCSAPCVSAM